MVMVSVEESGPYLVQLLPSQYIHLSHTILLLRQPARKGRSGGWEGSKFIAIHSQ
jgi:hypothetical protein